MDRQNGMDQQNAGERRGGGKKMALALAAGATCLSSGIKARRMNAARAVNGGARWVRSGRRRAWLGTYMRLVLAYSSCRSCALVPAGGSNRTSLVRGEARAAWKRAAATGGWRARGYFSCTLLSTELLW